MATGSTSVSDRIDSTTRAREVLRASGAAPDRGGPVVGGDGKAERSLAVPVSAGAIGGEDDSV